MIDTATLALCISGAALAVSTIPATMQVLTYRRAGAKVAVTFHKEINVGPGDIREFNLVVTPAPLRSS